MENVNEKLVAAELIFPDGEVNTFKINLISGVITSPLVQTLYEGADGDIASVQKIHDIFSDLFYSGQHKKLYDSIDELCGSMGLQFNKTFSPIRESTEALAYFLKSFLLDFEDIMEEFRGEKLAE